MLRQLGKRKEKAITLQDILTWLAAVWTIIVWSQAMSIRWQIEDQERGTMLNILENLSDQELALLQATKASENAQSALELAANAETYPHAAMPALASLVERNILEPYEQWDGSTRYMYAPNGYAQGVYDALYGPLVR